MNFERYIHLERLGNDEVRGIEFGECWIFPKLDGSNGSVWWQHDRVCTGSRNRKLPEALSNQELSEVPADVLPNDNQGFARYIGENRPRFVEFFKKYPNRRLYGEWLVPHAFKGYRESAWHRFYVFDVASPNFQIPGVGVAEAESEHFIPYSVYEESLKEFDIDYVVPQAKIYNPTYDALLHEVKQNTFLCEDGKGPGEGIVIKNYGFYNQYGRQVWAKIVSNEFKEEHTKFHGVAEKSMGKSTEEAIVDLFCTAALIEKEYAKIVNEMSGWNSRYIPRLFHTVFHCIVTEEMWEILRKLGNKVTVNFGMLQALIIIKIKSVKKELF